MLNQQQFFKIIELQKKLDLKITKIRLVTESETLTARFLALLVEIGEFANEQRCFKYWSSKPSSAKLVMLEEYIDGLHFILSIGNTLNINYKNYIFTENVKVADLKIAFIELFHLVTVLYQTKQENDFFALLNLYFTIGNLCEFDNQDIFSSYLEKNAINLLRQEQNY